MLKKILHKKMVWPSHQMSPYDFLARMNKRAKSQMERFFFSRSRTCCKLVMEFIVR